MFTRFPSLPARALIVSCLLAVCVIGGACTRGGSAGGEAPGPTVQRAPEQGDPRSLQLGFDAIPAARTSDAYIDAFATAAKYADAVVIRRTPPWSDFLPGAQVSQATAETTTLETRLLKQYTDLKLVYAIDPTDAGVQRSRIANLPADIDPARGFADPRIAAAFQSYVTYVISNYHPAYLAIGVEINMLYERNRPQFDAFVTLYDQLYAVAKAAQPDIQVFPTFQLEDLLGTSGEIHPAHWEVVDAFRGKMDAFALTTYPYLGGVTSAAQLPEDYYTQVTAHWDGPVMITAAGYPSAPVSGQPVIGTEQDQAAFLTRLLDDAEKAGFTLVAWGAALDPAYTTTGANTAFKDIGLRHSDGGNKLAWTLWEDWARRPLSTQKAASP